MEKCSIDELDDLEKKYIQEYNTISPNGYNILAGGQRRRAKLHFCKLCGAQIATNSTYCIDCGHKIQRVCERPNRDELKIMIRTQPFTQIAKKYNVTDNAVRKWCDLYNLPRTKNKIKFYSEKEWKNI